MKLHYAIIANGRISMYVANEEGDKIWGAWFDSVAEGFEYTEGSFTGITSTRFDGFFTEEFEPAMVVEYKEESSN